MTTLPQTSPPRLPRPNGQSLSTNGHGALAHAHGGAAASGAAAPTGMTGADIWRVIRSNALLIVASIAVAMILGFFVNLFLSVRFPRFSAVGYVVINPPTIFNPITQKQESLNDFNTLSVEQRTAASLLKSDSLFSRVLQNQNGRIRDTAWFKAFDNNVPEAKKELADDFVATPLTDSKLIQVSMSCRVAADAKVIVEEIVNQHLELQTSLANSRNFTRREQLVAVQTKLKDQQSRLAQDQRGKMAKLNGGGATTSGRLGELETQMQKLAATLVDVSGDATAARQNLEALTAQLARGDTPSQVEREVNTDPYISKIRDRIDNTNARIIGDIGGMGAESKLMQKLQEQKRSDEGLLDEATTRLRTNKTQELLDIARNVSTREDQRLEAVKKEMADLRATLGELTITYTDYLSDQERLDGVRADLRSVEDQLTGLLNSIGGNATGVAWATTPEIPDVQSFPNLKISLSIAFAVGLMVSLGIAFLREMMDTTVRSPRDIARVGQMNLLGMIPHQDDDPQAAAAPLPTAIYHAPTSLLAEQYRQVRTRLQHTAALDATRSILVTSPGPGDGKSVVACNLACGLALNGRQILLVDANFRRPELHKIFDVPNDQGLSTTLGQLENFEGAVQKTTVPNLDVLPTGPKPSNATELFESQLMIDFIERALEVYDHVIFDTGPLLFVSETVALAPRVDGVITVVRARTNSRGLLQRMRDALRQIKAEHLGVVLNAVRSQGGGYYGRNIEIYYDYQNGHAAN